MPDVGIPSLQRLADDGNGFALQFDDGFEADRWFGLNLTDTMQGGATLFVDYAELGEDVFGGFAGFTELGGTGALFGGDPGAPAVRAEVVNSNIEGVKAGSGIANGVAARAVRTGIELRIPLPELVDQDGCDIRITAFINGQARDFVSNQVLPGIGGGTWLGDPRFIDFNTIPGQQFATVPKFVVSAAAARLVPTAGGQRLEVTAGVFGPGSSTLRWSRNQSLLTDGGRISGSTTARLSIDDYDPATDAGTYEVTVGTPCGFFGSGFVEVGATGCNLADLAEPFGTLDFRDIDVFVSAFLGQDPLADLNNDNDLNFLDIETFVAAFLGGCQ